MHAFLKRALGLYFLVSSLAYIPAGIFMFGVQNPYGPAWVIPAIPLVQGLITAVAGLWLYRSGASNDVEVDLAWPPLESFLQLFGVYFAVGGLVSLARPLSSVLFFNESIGLSAGSNLASAATSIAIGGFLAARPQALASYLTRRTAA
jgi:hypothetical protein